VRSFNSNLESFEDAYLYNQKSHKDVQQLDQVKMGEPELKEKSETDSDAAE
jgi:hypothetical protein